MGNKALPRNTPTGKFKSLPSNSEAEQTLLGLLILNPGEVFNVAEVLSPDDFYSSRNRVLYETVRDMALAGEEINLVSLVEKLKTNGLLDTAGGAAYVSSLIDAGTVSSNPLGYAKVIKEKARQRRLIEVAREVAVKAYSNQMDEALKIGFSELLKLLTEKTGSSDHDFMEEVKRVCEKLRESDSENDEEVVKTSYPEIDETYGGLRKGELVIVAARPGMGKTAFALNLAVNLAKGGKSSLFISLEMSAEQLAKRAIACEARVDTKGIFNKQLSDYDWVQIENAVHDLDEQIKDGKLIICDDSTLTLEGILAKIKRWHAQLPNLAAVFIDYLQLIPISNQNTGYVNRVEEVGRITRALKIIANTLNIPVVVLSQLNRKVEYREDRRPRLADLRDSGAIEQDADVVIFIYRDEVYNKSEDNPDRGIAELIIAKNRNGSCGTVKIGFIKEYGAFNSLVPDTSFDISKFGFDSDEKEKPALQG